MDGRPGGGGPLGLAALVALGIFILSGGVYAGTDGPARAAALVVGLVAVVLALVLVFVRGRTIGTRHGPSDPH